jgi:hypothetical protein
VDEEEEGQVRGDEERDRFDGGGAGDACWVGLGDFGKGRAEGRCCEGGWWLVGEGDVGGERGVRLMRWEERGGKGADGAAYGMGGCRLRARRGGR